MAGGAGGGADGDARGGRQHPAAADGRRRVRRHRGPVRAERHGQHDLRYQPGELFLSMDMHQQLEPMLLVHLVMHFLFGCAALVSH